MANGSLSFWGWEQGGPEVCVASGIAVSGVWVGFDTLVLDACLVGEAGPGFVGEAGLIDRADGT